MSRVGRLPIPLPSGVKADVKGQTVTVTGPKGTMTHDVRPEITVALEDGSLVVTRPNDDPKVRAFHGLTRALLNNLVMGVSAGFEKTLLIEGTGYRASLQGKTLNLQVGYSHPVQIEPPKGVDFFVDNPTTIRIQGIDRALVGQVSADVRKVRKPEPYKGKGIRYSTERIRRKVGKAGGK